MEDLVSQVLADPAVAAVGTALMLAAIALWIAAAWWAYADATRRADNTLVGYIAAAWVLLSTPLMLPLSLGVYALARPQVAAGDRRVKSLIQELAATGTEQRCPACGSETGPEWMRCPTCATWLAAPCAACSRWSDVTLELCPWCGDESRERPFVPDRAPVAAFAGLPERRRRVARRIGAPSVQPSRRTEGRKLPVASESRRVGRTLRRA